MFSNTKRFFGALLVTLFVTGCASTQSLNDVDRHALKSVKLDPAVKKDTEMYLLAPGAAIGMMFGAVGGIVTAIANQNPTVVLQQFVDRHGISIEKIVREEIEAALKSSGKSSLVTDAETANATLSISVKQYGFSVPSAISSKVVPVLYLTCEMVDRSGKIIWSAGDRVLPSVFSAVDSVSFEEMKNDPAILEAAWRQAARIIAENIVNTL